MKRGQTVVLNLIPYFVMLVYSQSTICPLTRQMVKDGELQAKGEEDRLTLKVMIFGHEKARAA